MNFNLSLAGDSRKALVMSCFAILALLPALAASMPSPAPGNDTVQMCIFHDINCPTDGSLNYANLLRILRVLLELRTPDRCSCDLNTETCLRPCLYSYLLKGYVVTAVALSPKAEIDAAKKKAIELVEQQFKPCLLENRNCSSSGLPTDKESMSIAVKNYRQMHDLPEDCLCNLDIEICARSCVYLMVTKNQHGNL